MVKKGTTEVGKPSSTKVRNVCWTLNNYDEANVEYLKNTLSEITTYSVFSKEVGEMGTPHLQGYSEFENPRNTGKGWSNFQKMFGGNLPAHFHFAPRMGTAKQASDYCKYSDYSRDTHSGTVLNEYVFECGEITQQGKRVDYEKAIADLSTRSAIDVLKEQPSLLPMYNVMKTIKRDLMKMEHRDSVKVIVRFGDAGCGKSESAFKDYPDIYRKPKGVWWGSYSGQTEILIDDFYGNASGIQYNVLLEVLDKYKYEIEVKGGFVPANWTTVVITSNDHPGEWYGGMTPALARRFSEVWEHRKDCPPVMIPIIPDTEPGWKPPKY